MDAAQDGGEVEARTLALIAQTYKTTSSAERALEAAVGSAESAAATPEAASGAADAPGSEAGSEVAELAPEEEEAASEEGVAEAAPEAAPEATGAEGASLPQSVPLASFRLVSRRAADSPLSLHGGQEETLAESALEQRHQRLARIERRGFSVLPPPLFQRLCDERRALEESGAACYPTGHACFLGSGEPEEPSADPPASPAPAPAEAAASLAAAEECILRIDDSEEAVGGEAACGETDGEEAAGSAPAAAPTADAADAATGSGGAVAPRAVRSWRAHKRVLHEKAAATAAAAGSAAAEDGISSSSAADSVAVDAAAEEAALAAGGGGGSAPPILVLCQTNHALDQFLEGIFASEPRAARQPSLHTTSL